MSIFHLVSGPRNLSTALMYSFAQRPDCGAVDEPYYAHYLTKTGKNHPGKSAILLAQSSDAEIVTQELKHLAAQRKEVFIKNMAHHLRVLDNSILENHKVILLIREPKALITSFAKVIESPTMEDIGLEDEYAIYEYLLDRGNEFVVVDSGELLINPEFVLRAVCEGLGVRFYGGMLTWPEGPRKFDGVWAPHWYKSVHQSTGFSPQKSTSTKLPKHLESLYSEAKPLYEKLFAKAIKSPHQHVAKI